MADTIFKTTSIILLLFIPLILISYMTELAEDNSASTQVQELLSTSYVMQYVVMFGISAIVLLNLGLDSLLAWKKI